MIGFLTRCMIALLSFALTGATILSVGLTLRLSWGPIALPSVARDVETKINARLGGWSLSLGSAAIDFQGAAGSLGVAFLNVALKDDRGAAVLAAPAAMLTLDRAAALSEELRIRRIELRGVEAVVSRAADGEISLAVRHPGGGALPTPAARRLAAPARPETTPSPPIEAPAAGRLLDILSGKDAPPLLATLQEVRLRGSSLIFVDSLAGRVWNFSNVDVRVLKNDAGYGLKLAGGLRLKAEGDPLPLTMDAILPRGSDRAQITLGSPGVDISSLVAQDPALAPLSPLDGVLEATAQFELDLSSGAISPINGKLALRKAGLRIDGAKAAPIDRAEARIQIDPAAESVRLKDISIAAPSLSLEGDVAIDVVRDPSGAAKEISVRMAAHSGEWTAPQFFTEKLRLKRALADFSFSVGDKGARARGFLIDVGGVTVKGSGHTDFAKSVAEADYQLQLELGAFKAADFARLWPKTLSADGRAWVIENITAGRITNARMSYRSGGLKNPEQFELKFDFDGLTARYMVGMPPIREGAGSGVVGLDRLDITATDGFVAAPGGGRIKVGGSKFAITSFKPEYPPSETELKATGEIRDLLTLLDQPPLKLISAYGRDLSGISGNFAATGSMAFPLAKSLPKEDVKIEVAGDLLNVRARLAQLGKTATAKKLRVTASGDALTIAGAARYAGLGVRIDLREAFTKAGGSSVLKLATRLTHRDAERLFSLGRFVRSGAVAVSIQAALDAKTPVFAIHADAANAEIAIPALGWRKPKGVRGDARAQAQALSRGGILIDGVKARLGDLSVDGEFSTTRSGRLSALALRKITIGKRTEFSLSGKPRKGGGLELRGGGPKLDLSGLFKDGGAPAAAAVSEKATPLAFSFEFDKLYVGKSGAVEKAKATGERVADGRVAATFTAQAGRARLKGELALEGAKGERFLVSTDDAGAALRALGLYSGASGGRLAFFGVVRGARARGELRVRDVVLKDAPILAQVLSVATVFGIFDRMGTGGTSFTRVSVPFEMTPRAVKISEGVAAGPSLGISFKGDINRDKRSLDLAGTLTPANIVQGLLSEIPVIQLFVGDGLLGVSFKIRGPVAKPKVDVNPLSALAPGPFKKLFSGERFDVEEGAKRPNWRERRFGDD
ncbi:MAG: DUF3971 domain-containing protein [Neomegalonema sp.]|nr:DUF3971 domain-containing protein [Neomegalonema sp.]